MVKSKHNVEVVVETILDFKMAAMYNECNERQPYRYYENHGLNNDTFNYIVNLYLVFLDNKHIIIHLSSSNACSYQIMDYSCNHRRFGTRCCTNIVKCELNCVVNISLTVLEHIVHMS